MKIIEPSVGLWKQGDDVKAHVAKCARVCYGKETGNDDVTINTLLNFATNTIDYIISANIDIADEVEEQIQQLLQYDNYKDIYYVRNNNKFNFYLKTYSND